jgi:hypothetical protein
LEGGAITNPKPLCNLQHEQTYGLGREAPCAVGEKVFEVRAEQRQRHDVTPQHLLCTRVPAHTRLYCFAVGGTRVETYRSVGKPA